MPKNTINKENASITNIQIGKLIQEELRAQNKSVSWLSEQLNCDRRNVYDIFSRTYIDTGLLYRISLVLQKDFFEYYSETLKLAEKQDVTPPPPKPEPPLRTLIDKHLQTVPRQSAQQPKASPKTTRTPASQKTKKRPK